MARDYQRRWPFAAPPRGDAGAEEIPVEVDLLRAELYQLLDEVARAPAAERRRRVRAFERAWGRFKLALRRSGSGRGG